MTGSELAALGKSAKTLVSPMLRIVRQELARRGAGDLAASTPATVDAELDEALRVLLGESDTLPRHICDRIKALLSDPPAIFADEPARDWLRRDDVQVLLKEATIALVTEAPLDGHLDEAKRLYGVSSTEETWLGEPLFVYAVSFLALTLKAKVGLDTRLLLSADNRRSHHHGEHLDRIERKIDGLTGEGNLITPDLRSGGDSSDRWHSVVFEADRGLAAALLGQMLGPGDVSACPRLIEADTLLTQLEAVGVARLAGMPGAGKSISMLQVARTVAERGWSVVRLDEAHTPLPPLLRTEKPVLHLIDDAHLANAAHLRRLEEACGATTWLLSVHTIAPGNTAGYGTLYLDAQRAVRTIAASLEADYDRTFREVRRLDDRIGASMMDERLEDRLQAASKAEYPWQFCFILSGGWRRANAIGASARSMGADLTLAALAIRQLAARDAHCSPASARSLLEGIQEDIRTTESTKWLIEQRLLLAAYDLRCPHQRFGAVLIDNVLAGRSAEEREAIQRVLERVLCDRDLPLAGFATLLHELRFAHAQDRYRGWSHLVDPDWLAPGLARCWDARTPLEIRDAAWFLAEIGAVHRDERSLFDANRHVIAEWISACPPGACYALGRLANHIFNTDETVGRALRASVDLGVFARNLDASDARRTAEVIELASSLRAHWEPEGRAAFMGALDEARLLRLMGGWPQSVHLSFAASIAKFVVYADEDYGLRTVKALLTAIEPQIQADPINAFHEIDDILSDALRLLDVLGIYRGKLAPNGRRKSIGRKYAAAFAKASPAKAISSAKKRQYQSCAMLLTFLRNVAPETYFSVIHEIDWTAIEATIGEDWAQGGRDGEVLLGVAFSDEESRAAIRTIVAANLHRMERMPARLALMLPDLAIEQLDSGRSVGFDSRWEWSALIVGHFAVARPDLLERLLDPRLAGIASDLSQRSPTFLNEKLLLLRIIADVAPHAFDRMLEQIDPAGATVGWRDALRGSNNNRMPGGRAQAQEVAAFLVEMSLRREGALGDLARELRRRYPRASVPNPKTLESLGPYRLINHGQS